MKRATYLLIVLSILMSMAAVGCGGTPTPAPPKPTVAPPPPSAATATPAQAVPTKAAAAVIRPLVVAVKTETVSLDPHQNDYDYSQKAQHGAYESLLNYTVKDGKVDVGPGLAASYKTDDAKVWTLTLQKGVKFTDGTPFNAEAVKYNFDRVRGMKQAPASRLPVIDSVDVVDESTVRITLKNAYPVFSENLTKLFMVSPTAAKAHVATDDPWGNKWMFDNAVGTGPYKVESWVKGQTVTMVKNPDYWRGWSGNHVEKIILRFIKEAATRRLLLESGDVDLAEGISFDDLDALSKVKGVIVLGNEQPSMVCMMLRLKGPLKDAKVRKAIQLAFSYDDFIKGVLSGRALYPQSPLPTSVWAFDKTLPAMKQDLAAAKKLMADAGFPSGGFSVQIATISPYGWFQPREAQILQANLKELGITATIQDFPDAAAYYAAIGTADKGPDIYAWSFNNSFNDPEDNFRRMFYSTMTPDNGGINYIRYSNSAVDALIDKGLTMSKREDRFPVYAQLQKTLMDDAVAIFAAQPQFFMTTRDSLQGYVWNPFSINNSYEWYDLWLSK
jgi:peptide/nickel transport system substrate-binding protein